ncbi:hypothetical protein ACSBR2_036830 [Camellia fascicularis]
MGIMDELVHETELYRTSWHLLHFLKNYIILDRCFGGTYLGRIVVIFFDGCVSKIFG